MISSMVQSAHPLTMPRSSLTSSGGSGVRRTVMTSGERKEDILQAGRRQPCLGAQLVERSRAAHRAVRKQNETIADAFGITELMNREHERTAGCCNTTDEPHHVAGLPQIEAVEWLIHQQKRLRREQRERQHQPPCVAF